MKIGVLEAGPVAEQLVGKFGSYTRFFKGFLAPHLPEANFRGYKCYEGDLPQSPDEADCWIVTGSKFGAYEAHDWIPPLEDFLRRTYDAGAPIAGFCFGHQILAQALGGKVIKSPKGWGLGAMSYDITEHPAWMAGAADRYTSHALHQDQVVALPDGASVIARSDFCEYAALAYGPLDRPRAITVQSHPEFSAEFLGDLIDVRRGTLFDDATAEAALATLGTAVNNSDWGRWVASFFKSRLA